jgi:hypothetical protein
MPYKVKEIFDTEKYMVYNPKTKKVHSFATEKEKADRQVALLRRIEEDQKKK